jgi:tetratricopeptide (TPR) repeat protein
MRHTIKIMLLAFSLFLQLVAVSSAGLSAGDIKTDPGFQLPNRSFAKCCPKPEWWNSVQAPQVSSIKQLLKIWQNKKISKRVKAKAFYQAILRFEDTDDDIVAMSVSLYGHVDRDYPNRLQMLEYGVARFFDHKRSLKGYRGKVGDRSAGLVIKLARLYKKQNRPQDAIAIVSKMVAMRGSEINDNQLERLSLIMIDALQAVDRKGEALDIAHHAISVYNGSWEKSLLKQQKKLQSEMGASSWLHGPRLDLLAIGGGLLGLLLFGFALMRIFSNRQQGNGSPVHFGR